MPGKGNAVVNGLGELVESTASVGVAHVVENSDREALLVTSTAGSGELEDIGGSGAVGGLDLVVVGGVLLEAADLDLMEVLGALGDGGLGARRSTVVAGQVVVS